MLLPSMSLFWRAKGSARSRLGVWLRSTCPCARTPPAVSARTKAAPTTVRMYGLKAFITCTDLPEGPVAAPVRASDGTSGPRSLEVEIDTHLEATRLGVEIGTDEPARIVAADALLLQRHVRQPGVAEDVPRVAGVEDV